MVVAVSKPFPNVKQLYVRTVRDNICGPELRTASQFCTEAVPITTASVTGDKLVEVTLEAYAAAELMVPANHVQHNMFYH